MRFYVETFGCQMNMADGLEMGRRLKARGFRPTTDPAEADLVLVNTCTVRQQAENRALSRIGRLAAWKKGAPGRLLVLAGCAAERLGPRIRGRFPHVSVVVGAKSIARFEEALAEHFPDWGFDGPGEFRDGWGWGPGLDDTALPGEGPGAFVTVMRGCNYACTYCVVPAVRGREIYRAAASVLTETAERARRGQREITFLGQTVNSYRPAVENRGPDGRPIDDFSDLLRAAAAIPEVRRLRFMSPHPHYVDGRFVRAVGDLEKVAPHLHLPVQSGSDTVLARMRRNTTRAEYLDGLSDLRRARPGLAVTTDFIVGFPGETDGDFDMTLSLAEEADLDGAYCFAYSPRPGTPAAKGPDDVPRDLKERRLARLLGRMEKASQRKAAAMVGRTLDVLVEDCRPLSSGWRLEARTPENRKMFADARRAHPAGSFARATVAEAKGKTLWGTVTA